MKKERIIYIDVMRSFAILLVVLCHATELYYSSSYYNLLPTSQVSFFIQSFFYVISRLGVPLFLMITGVLMLNKKEINIKSFYKDHLLSLFIITELWLIINNFFYCLINQTEIDIVNILYQMLFLEPLRLNQMWYMSLILGIYIFIPYVKKGIEGSLATKLVLIPLILGVIVYFINPTINILLNASFSNITTKTMNLDVSFIGGIGGIYVLTGYYLSKIKREFKQSILLLLLTIFIILNIECLLYLKSLQFDYTGFLWYSNIFTYISSMIVFLLVKNFSFLLFLKKICFYLSRISFAIFLIHMIILSALFHEFNVLTFPIPVQIVTYFFVTLLLCVFCIFILDKILPTNLKKKILYIR